MNPDEKWKKIEEARKILKLPVKTTRKEIIEKYRKMIKNCHPDKGGNEEIAKKINDAYQILIEYCDNYVIELNRTPNGITPDEWWFHQFGNDPIWGRKVNKNFKDEK